ncbi:hypothetical protein ACT6NV_02995 [Robiginitalea sp. IMCC44478]|uniref:hypothetical protein n=1 Tax=Robiginitalea sp. IMCC44478 TaxID=3459122 RepID=UPI0040413FD5
MKNWILYVFCLGFAVYWASNLLLWFPWSYSPSLGIILMLSVLPFLWMYAIFLALKTFPDKHLFKGALSISLILLLSAVVMDYIFFGLIRNAMEELYHPTTLYGYAFLLVLPFIVGLIFKKRIMRIRIEASKSMAVKTAAIGFVCIAILTLIIVKDIEL